jgi:hypothetical protein
MCKRLCWVASQLIPLLVAIPWLASCHSVAAGPPQTIEVAKEVALQVPATWQKRDKGRNSLELVSTAPADAKVVLARALVTTENRRSAQEAVERLGDIAAEDATAPTLTTIQGWPAIERTSVITLPRVGADDRVKKPVTPVETVTVRTVAIAVGSTIVRVETTLAPKANASLLDEVDAKQTLNLTIKGDPVRAKSALDQVQGMMRRGPAAMPLPLAPPSPQDLLELQVPRPRVGSAVGELRPATAEGATSVQQGVGELEVAASNDGRNVVIAANSGFSNSTDSGRTYTARGGLPAPFPSDGDPSLAVGASGNFYLAWIGYPNGTAAANNVTGCSNSLARSTDSGQTFAFRGHMIVCPNTGTVCFPDQEHIAADRVNRSGGNDQIYNVWRNFTPAGTATSCGSLGSGFVAPRIVCSSNGGTSFGPPTNIGNGDFPRVAVGRDGFVYVVYVSGSSVMLNKFSSCANGLNQQTGFPVTVGSYTAPSCPVPGLDRCNDGNTLASPTAAVDDTNANHVYVAWATSSASGNENIIVADSSNGGSSFPRSVRVSGGAAARRFMPWVCATSGVAHVGWYDRRSATASANDRTRYWGGTAAVASSGLVAGSEYDVSGVDDAECSTWPCTPRASGDSESCSVQPQLAGVCCTNPPPPATPVCGATRCDLSSPTCPAGNTCQFGGGCPKYGDYNGIGCAAGRVYHAWSSATPPAGVTSPGAGINVYADVRAPAPGVGAIWVSTGTACSGESCPGWTRLDNNNKTLAIAAADDGTLYQLHRDGWIWRSTGTACTGDSCPGWQRLDNNSKTVAIAAGNSLYQLHHDGWIWRYTGTPCSGESCPGWQRLDRNSKTVAIAAAGNNLYQLHHDGWIWRYTGTPCSGDSCPGWQRLDNNSKAVAIAAAGDALYQLHNDGWIWRYTGTPCSGDSCPGWQRLDNNSKAVAIAASGGNLYQLHNDGWIWRYTGTPCSGESCPGWQRLDNNSKAAAIIAAGNNLYQVHHDGWIWRYTGTPCSGDACPGWQRLDNNPSTFQVAAGGSQLYQLHADPIYQLHSNGRIWRYTGPRCDGDYCPGWQMLDNNPNTSAIAAAGRQLFQLHRDGKIWRHTGAPCSGASCPGWQMLDNNSHSTAIAASDHELYQLHNDGKIWRHTGAPCSGTVCSGWQLFDNNAATRAIAVAGRQLFQLHQNGEIWRSTGVPCSGTSCPGWQRLDNNPATTAIVAAGRQLFQRHSDGSIWRSTGAPCSGNACPGWQRLDNNPATTAIVAAGRQLFQLHNNGSIWRATGTPCSGNSCPGWQRLDNNTSTRGIAASGLRLAQRHQSGWIWKSLGGSCSGESCPSWQRLDNNAATTAIVVGGSGM